jgi:hypothetical protein
VSHSLFVETCGAHTMLGPVVLVYTSLRELVLRNLATVEVWKSKHILIFFGKWAWAELNKTVHSVYMSSAVCTVLYSYMAPPWPQYCQPMRAEQYILYEPHQPITGFKIRDERRTQNAVHTDQVTYRALGSRWSQKFTQQIIYLRHFWYCYL